MEKPPDPKNKPTDPDKNVRLDNKKDHDDNKDEPNRKILDSSEESNDLNVTLRHAEHDNEIKSTENEITSSQKSLNYEKEDQPSEDRVSGVIDLDALIKNYDSKYKPLQFHIGNTLYEVERSKNINRVSSETTPDSPNTPVDYQDCISSREKTPHKTQIIDKEGNIHSLIPNTEDEHVLLIGNQGEKGDKFEIPEIPKFIMKKGANKTPRKSITESSGIDSEDNSKQEVPHR
ncbi:hypothetical protein JTB14_010380 [Gonioctena quinquepunctata]|nr:hypothetical protein JTB14_010380 [Gonioctena quinquepunctata]